MPETVPRTARRYRQRNPAFNAAKVQQLADQGLTCPDIAKLQGCNQSTIWRFLDQSKPQSQALTRFKTSRAEVLATLQAHSLQLQAKVLESFEDHDIQALGPGHKTGLLMALNAQHGTLYDKERLERNLSTSNQSVMSTMLDQTVKSLYAPVKTPTRKSVRKGKVVDVTPLPVDSTS
jgi:predicted transcriptional regulator